ncbi:MAG TPA: TonB-dependent receptor, partial [Nevskia sp.]|nr:TonB-dependent receptor [Nevskia sp.]
SRDRVFVAGGKNLLGESMILDYRVGFTQGSYKKPYDYNSAFNYTLNPGETAAAGIIYDLSGRGHTPAYTISGADYTDSTRYQLSSFSNSTAHNFDKEFSFAENLKIPVQWTGSDNEDLQFGVNLRLRKKRTTAQPRSYDTVPNLLLSAITPAPPETYYDGQYRNAPDIPPSYLQSVLGAGTVGPAELVSAAQQYLDAKENIYAGYGQYQVTRGRFGVLGGLRVEGTRDSSDAFQTTAGSDAITPVHASHGYTNFFPSLQGRFEIQPDLIARATYSSTLARPGFNQANTSQSVDLGSGIVTTGNPSLKPATAQGFDLTIEQYLKGAGILSAGVFDKEISNYIVGNELFNQSLPQYPGVPLRFITFSNAGHSHARGFEFNWEQRFRELPGIWNGLGASFNYTYVDSKFEIRPGEASPLPSTSRNTWNAAMFYEKYGLSLRLAGYSVSKDLFAIGSDKTSDVYNAQRTNMDFGSSYTFIEHWAVYFNAKNLLDTPHKFYEGTAERTIQREFYGQTYQLGVRFDY